MNDTQVLEKINITQNFHGGCNTLNFGMNWEQDPTYPELGHLNFTFELQRDGAMDTKLRLWSVDKEDLVKHLRELAANLHKAADSLV